MSIRDQHTCLISGKYYAQLTETQLPNYEDIYLAYQWRSSQQSKFKSGYDEIMNKLLIDVQNIWYKASIPTVSHLRCKQLMTIYHQNYTKLRRNFVRDHKKPNFEQKLKAFNNVASKLFDIAACKCSLNKKKCYCEKSNKVPNEEIKFLSDQRGDRRMFIGNIDRTNSNRRSKTYKRKESGTLHHELSESDIIISDDSNLPDSEPINDPDFSPSPCCSKSLQNRFSFPATALIADRTGTSDRTTALLASAVLQDYGAITEQDSSKTIDRSKIRRNRSKKRSELQHQDQAGQKKLLVFSLMVSMTKHCVK